MFVASDKKQVHKHTKNDAFVMEATAYCTHKIVLPGCGTNKGLCAYVTYNYIYVAHVVYIS